jgi:putative tricarboxylic transport membrane protein
VLGNLVESNYRRSLALSGGELSIFLEDPISIVFLVLAVVIVSASLFNEWRVSAKARKERTA